MILYLLTMKSSSINNQVHVWCCWSQCIYIHICKNGIFEMYLHRRTLKQREPNTHRHNVELVRDYRGRFVVVFQFIDVCHMKKIMHSIRYGKSLRGGPLLLSQFEAAWHSPCRLSVSCFKWRIAVTHKGHHSSCRCSGLLPVTAGRLLGNINCLIQEHSLWLDQ